MKYAVVVTVGTDINPSGAADDAFGFDPSGPARGDFTRPLPTAPSPAWRARAAGDAGDPQPAASPRLPAQARLTRAARHVDFHTHPPARRRPLSPSVAAARHAGGARPVGAP